MGSAASENNLLNNVRTSWLFYILTPNMLMRIFILTLLAIWAFEKVGAAAAPDSYLTHTIVSQPALRPVLQIPTTLKKQSLVQKLEWKLFEKKLKKQAAHLRAGSTGTKSTLSTIALILAIATMALLFIPTLAGFAFFLGIGALVTGIISLTRKNKSRSTKTKSIIAVVVGGLILLGWVVLIIALAAGGFAVE
jgi:hypothetical protein